MRDNFHFVNLPFHLIFVGVSERTSELFSFVFALLGEGGQCVRRTYFVHFVGLRQYPDRLVGRFSRKAQ